MNSVLEIIRRHKAGEAVGIYSVCSAHPMVIKAALCRAKSDDTLALIESTSNQVNQDGGYTGMLPSDFRTLVHGLANEVGFPIDNIVLGGDHLGPNCWQGLPPSEAMDKSEILISLYVEAGFRKIHLDCSMPCRGDPTPLGDADVAKRAARLCAVAERSWSKTGGAPPVYVIGTEVPTPGGATEDLEELQVTRASAAAETLAVHKAEFARVGLESAWNRVIALVVQPGVEFDHERVIDYRHDRAASLSNEIRNHPHLVFEAHSTDYQTPLNLQALVQDHFAILKVGPALTYALRQAFWALDQIEQEWVGKAKAVHLRQTMLDAMRQDSTHWKSHYGSTGEQLVLDLQYSLSDRARYYWPNKNVENAVTRLVQSLQASPPPLTLIMQYLPGQCAAIREKQIHNNPEELLMHKIDEVLIQYSSACNQGGK